MQLTCHDSNYIYMCTVYVREQCPPCPVGVYQVRVQCLFRAQCLTLITRTWSAETRGTVIISTKVLRSVYSRFGRSSFGSASFKISWGQAVPRSVPHPNVAGMSSRWFQPHWTIGGLRYWQGSKRYVKFFTLLRRLFTHWSARAHGGPTDVLCGCSWATTAKSVSFRKSEWSMYYIMDYQPFICGCCLYDVTGFDLFILPIGNV